MRRGFCPPPHAPLGPPPIPPCLNKEIIPSSYDDRLSSIHEQDWFEQKLSLQVSNIFGACSSMSHLLYGGTGSRRLLYDDACNTKTLIKSIIWGHYNFIMVREVKGFFPSPFEYPPSLIEMWFIDELLAELCSRLPRYFCHFPEWMKMEESLWS